MARQIIRLTESDLHRIIKKSVNRILREGKYGDWRDNYEEWMNYSGDDKEEGQRLNRAWNDALKSQYQGDEAGRLRALNNHFREKDSIRNQRQSPAERAREAEWERKYNIEHGIVGDDNFDFDKAVEKFEKQKMRSNKKPNIINKEDDAILPQSSRFSGKSPEELEQMMKDMGFVK